MKRIALAAFLALFLLPTGAAADDRGTPVGTIPPRSTTRPIKPVGTIPPRPTLPPTDTAR